MSNIKNKLASTLPSKKINIIISTEGGNKTLSFKSSAAISTAKGRIPVTELTMADEIDMQGKLYSIVEIDGLAAPAKTADATIAQIAAETDAEIDAIDALDLDDERDGEVEQREAYLQRLAADIGPDDISPDEADDDDLQLDDDREDDFDYGAEDDFNGDLDADETGTEVVDHTADDLAFTASLEAQEEAEIDAAVSAITDEQLLEDLNITSLAVEDSLDEELPVEETPEEKEDREFIEEFNAVMDKVLAYDLPSERAAYKLLYEHMTMRDLKERLAMLEDMFGQPDNAKLLREAGQLVHRVTNSENIQNILKAFENNRAGFYRRLSRVEESIGVDSTFRKAMDPEYHKAAKEALVEQAVLRQALTEELARNGWAVLPENASFQQLLAGFKYAANMWHVNRLKIVELLAGRDTMHKEIERAHEHTRAQKQRSDDLSDTIDNIRADFARRVIPENTKCFLADTSGRNYLADKNYAAQKKAKLEGEFSGKPTYSKHLNLNNLVWVTDERLAMRFDHPEKAMSLLEDIIETSQATLKKNARGDIDITSVRVAGQSLNNIQVAVRGTILLDREGVKAFDKK